MSKFDAETDVEQSPVPEPKVGVWAGEPGGLGSGGQDRYTASVRDGLIEYVRKYKLTRAKLAGEMEFGLTQVIKYLNGKPDWNTVKFERKAVDVMRHAETRELYKVQIFPTSVTRQVNAVCETIRKTNDFGLIHSEAGWGKSSGKLLYAAEYPLATTIDVTRWNRGPHDQVRMLWHAAGNCDVHFGDTRASWLAKKFKDTNRPILIDNAHRLTRGGLQFWFDFHDTTGVPIMFFGNPEVMDLIRRNDQMFSRLGLVEMVSLNEDEYVDVARLLIKQMLKEEVSELEDLSVETISRKGHLRALRKQLNLAREIRELKKSDWRTAFRAAGTKLVREEEQKFAPLRGDKTKR